MSGTPTIGRVYTIATKNNGPNLFDYGDRVRITRQDPVCYGLFLTGRGAGHTLAVYQYRLAPLTNVLEGEEVT